MGVLLLHADLRRNDTWQTPNVIMQSGPRVDLRAAYQCAQLALPYAAELVPRRVRERVRGLGGHHSLRVGRVVGGLRGRHADWLVGVVLPRPRVGDVVHPDWRGQQNAHGAVVRGIFGQARFRHRHRSALPVHWRFYPVRTGTAGEESR